ncbi:hypothetical protein ACFLZB_04195 [Nanoarchaeota archaeon]
MSEKKLVVDQVKFTYEGLFDLNEFYRLLESFFYQRNWDRREDMNIEQVFPTGKHIQWELYPFKNITDYYRMHLSIKARFIDVVKVEVEHQGSKVKMDQGRVRLIFDGYIESDRNTLWESKPFFWFLRTVIEKYFYREHFLKQQKWLLSDFEELMTRIKTFFNVYREYERGMITRFTVP